MTTPRKIACLLIAMEAGEELKLKSDHTLAMASNDEPGLVMFDSKGNQNGQLFQVGSDLVYGLIADHARGLTEEDIKAIEKSLIDETEQGFKDRI